MTNFVYKAVGVLTLMVGAAVLIGWQFDIEILKSIRANWVSMKPNTALCFLLIGLAMLVRIPNEINKRPAWRHWACTLLVALVGAVTTLTILQMAFDIDLGIDQILFRESLFPTATSQAGRMAIDTAIFFVIAVGVTCYSNIINRRSEIILFSFILMSIGIGGCLTNLLYRALDIMPAIGIWDNTLMAAHTSFLFLLIFSSQILLLWPKGDKFSSLNKRTGLVIIITMGVISFSLYNQFYQDANHSIAFAENLARNNIDKDLTLKLHNVFTQFASSRLVSLNPINPENKPDPWQTKALEQFSYKKDELADDLPDKLSDKLSMEEFTQVVSESSKMWTKMMKPLYANKDCFNCHKNQNYKVGALVGGITTQVPLSALVDSSHHEGVNLLLIHFLLISVILFVIGLTHRLELSYILKKQETEKKFQNQSLAMQAQNQELIQAQIQAKENDKLKSAFISNISHEIRTPMNSILGFSRLMSEFELDQEQRARYCQAIDVAGNRLMMTVNDLLEISRIETEDVQITISTFDLISTCKKLLDIKQKRFAEKKVNFIFHNDLKYSFFKIKTDEEKLVQVLTHLVDNALKFTSEGIVEFGFSAQQSGQQIALHFFVKDTGIGIAQDYLEHIFDRFRQEDISMSRRYEGSGLGLAICKGYIDKLGGKIEVESKKGVGTLFSFSLPIEIAEYGFQSPTNPGQNQGAWSNLTQNLFEGKSLLIVDDDPFNLTLLREIIVSQTKAKCWTATNGQEGIEAFRSHPEIDLILMDIKMPVLSGIEATKIIRLMDTQVPIVALTAFSAGDESTQALMVGCNAILHKPLSAKELIISLKTFLIEQL